MQATVQLQYQSYLTINDNNMFTIFLESLLLVISVLTILWLFSVFIKNASIVDIFWGTGFVVANAYYFISSGDFFTRKLFLLTLVTIWGLRLSIYLAWRNIGKGEDYRNQLFKNYQMSPSKLPIYKAQQDCKARKTFHCE